MGGSKNKSPAQKQKTQSDDDAKKSGEKKKGKKKDKSDEGSSKAEITVIVNEEQAMKFIKNAKVITVQELARQLGVKISAANAFLKKLTKDGAIKKIGGFSGHHIYQPLSA
jgi:small subunit ribosomal protein S25e